VRADSGGRLLRSLVKPYPARSVNTAAATKSVKSAVSKARTSLKSMPAQSKVLFHFKYT